MGLVAQQKIKDSSSIKANNLTDYKGDFVSFPKVSKSKISKYNLYSRSKGISIFASGL